MLMSSQACAALILDLHIIIIFLLSLKMQAQTSDVVTSLLSLRAKTAILLRVAPPGGAAGDVTGGITGDAAGDAINIVGEVVGEEVIPAELVQVRGALQERRWR